MFEKPVTKISGGLERPEDIEARRVAQEKVDTITRSRDRLGGLVLSAIWGGIKGGAKAAVEGVEFTGGIPRMTEIAKEAVQGVTRKSDARAEDSYNNIVRGYEDKIDLATGAVEKKRFQRELEAIKNKWIQQRERDGQDRNLLLKYLGLT